jgi:hypothetical protein
MATAHTARTAHHKGSEDGPPAPDAGNVRTHCATFGTRAGGRQQRHGADRGALATCADGLNGPYTASPTG